MIISTGDIKEEYGVIDAIFAIDSHKEGIFRSADPNSAFKGVKEQLKKKCEQLGGNAIINCQFEYRIAVADGFASKKQVVEIFAYGTAVKTL
ncbi:MULTISPECIES: heavy metal-binding domain-containing protein [unclassified Clostridioides]|uniref:heavy metal-binding domain-containing protein n=1 Tax=unclassified Clostridioides TaxID=2635829 RepID=UPI001D105264|nr:heavy metal-binding domain-containing protein [Clostridioides sp. ZZV14-6150]MCC0667882.1 heavy metal-binding domain-containing protein [Clostridioides sp. ZZV14-6153]MCC0723694.1 heavy metal-binding domain-containing protein [Clostridioides sp. ZZV14-6104]MCC0724880.1 heavy metal-binding domain-containing protein [Clostridioides sp. ZZV14-6045]MCC0730748.1 heavy metal-binding domain-containing protein [Clostridioides sp. ZZV14-6048]MCC0736697.1 heavy metal-binding domain-containing protein